MRLKPSSAVVLILALGYAAMLALNLPGHLSYDSVVQLHEGRTHIRDTWAPAIFGVILGFFDQFTPGTALYVAASGALFYGALAAMIPLRPATSWAAVLVVLVLVCSPLVLIYQAIVWKDILFANCALAGCVALARAAKAWPKFFVRWAWLLVALVLLALATLVRQNGLVVAVCAAAALAWIGRGRGWFKGLAWGVGGLAAVVAVSHLMSVAVEPTATSADEATTKGVRILQRYDVIGAVARDPTFKTTNMHAFDPAADDVIHANAARYFTAQRVDTLAAPEISGSLKDIDPEAVTADWKRLIAEKPLLYAHQRLGVFHWLIAPPTLELCLPVFIGVDGPRDKLADLQIPLRLNEKDRGLHDYAKRFYATPLYAHLSYVALAFGVFLLLLLRRDPADIAVMALMAGGLAFAATFLIISLACDFRYLYMLDLAGMAGLYYLALDPRLKRKGA
jgi:hypothetical protein